MFDLVIKDAEIHDGAGSAPVHGDLGVTAGKITAIGGKLGTAKETVKADGLALAPGIIDGHPLRCADHLGSLRRSLARARRHHGGDGQLRLHHRALQTG